MLYEERSSMWNRDSSGNGHTIWWNIAKWNDVKSCNTNVKWTDGSGVDIFGLQLDSVYSLLSLYNIWVCLISIWLLLTHYCDDCNRLVSPVLRFYPEIVIDNLKDLKLLLTHWKNLNQININSNLVLMWLYAKNVLNSQQMIHPFQTQFAL